MAAMIDASEAKRLLGCDDDALNGHINSGSIRAQRQGGKLMLDRDDVEKLAGVGLVLDAEDGDEEGTIVLTGESDNLQIDLGKVDETADTLVPAAAAPVKASTQTLSFGNELEVVSVEEGGNTAEEPVFDDSRQTMELAFTDVGTGDNTAVDESEPGATGVQATSAGSSGSSRSASGSTAATAHRGTRSVRSNRARVEASPVPGWVVGLLAASLLLMLLGVAPVQVIGLWPSGERDRDGAAVRGVDDGLWAKLAGNFAGFSVEPNRARGGDGWTDIKDVDAQAVWRHQAYRGGKNGDERENALIIERVSEDGKIAYARKEGVQYPVREVKNGEATEEVVDLSAPSAK